MCPETVAKGVMATFGSTSGPANRLKEEASPYLLQHALNPVDWYPWGEEAIARAKKENKPIFLSVGYSTCHWCHVMESESFEDVETAKVLNQHFISIKVDREERPDIDRVYMSYVQATSGSGGWPMTVFLTPDLKPFFGGTYFPKAPNYGLPSFGSLLNSIATTWKIQQETVLAQSESIMEQLTQYLTKQDVVDMGSDVDLAIDAFIDGCAEKLISSFDKVYGGFSPAPKFPRPAELQILLINALRTNDADIFKTKEMVDMVKWTLQKISEGGIYDHVGGGFHRYSVDELWHVPHFEKMLYDNPQIAICCVQMRQWTGKDSWALIACGILDYIKRDMTDPLGGIYSAEDADSMDCRKKVKSEGAFYVWEMEELREVLTNEEFDSFALYYGVRTDGNCNLSEKSDPLGEFVGKNCLYVANKLSDSANALAVTEEQLQTLLSSGRRKIYAARKQRPKPHLDNKIVTAWNGMAISAFAQASSMMQSASVEKNFPVEGHAPSVYLSDAKKIANFILKYLWDEEASVMKRSACGGIVSVDGYADDYAWTIAGFLDLYEHSGELSWLKWAIKLQARMDAIFFDEQSGGYFSTSGNDQTILFRLKGEYDSAEPAATSIAVANLVRLSSIITSGSEEWMTKAKRTIQFFATRLKDMPHTMPQLAVAMHLYQSHPKTKKVVIRSSATDRETAQALLYELHKNYIPTKALIFVDIDDEECLQFWREYSPENLRVLEGSISQTPHMKQSMSDSMAFVCANFTCQSPTRDSAILAEQLLATTASGPTGFDISPLQKK